MALLFDGFMVREAQLYQFSIKNQECTKFSKTLIYRCLWINQGVNL